LSVGVRRIFGNKIRVDAFARVTSPSSARALAIIASTSNFAAVRSGATPSAITGATVLSILPVERFLESFRLKEDERRGAASFPGSSRTTT
jgi:hypothetical protein